MPPGTATVVDAAQIRSQFSEHVFPETAKITIKKSLRGLKIKWETDIGTNGEAILQRSDPNSISRIESEKITWDKFKTFALKQTARSFIFRGQPSKYKMRTSFHRTYRKDLVKYVAEDIPVAHRQLTAITKHIFNLELAQERGAFWNLLQHHGYPTPLLDWTFSPFVAAFFAYRRRKQDDDKDRYVRIIAFDRQAWISDFNQLEVVNFARPHFSLLETLAIENSRAIPQQSLSSLTNLDDIERYILQLGKANNKNYVRAFDLDADIRPHVMAELSLMGITAGSLFPGLDGACEELLGRHFHHQVAPLQTS